jgi:hypothetical protein
LILPPDGVASNVQTQPFFAVSIWHVKISAQERVTALMEIVNVRLGSVGRLAINKDPNVNNKPPRIMEIPIATATHRLEVETQLKHAQIIVAIGGIV